MEQLGSTLDHSQSLVGGLEKPPPGCQKPTHSRSSSTASSRHSRQNVKDWEVMDDLQLEAGVGGDGLHDLSTPGICEGFLMKRRNWPLKGWHKRYFVLDKGVLRYSRTQQDFTKGKLNGSLDVSLAVMSINKKSKRIDLDAGDNLYHVKAKSHDLFYIWVTKLSAHRVFKKNEAAHVHNGFLQALSQGGGAMAATRNGAMADAFCGHYQSTLGSHMSELPSTAPGVNGKVSAWLQQTHDPDICTQELNRVQIDLAELNRLVQRLQVLESGQAFSNGELQRIISVQNLTLEKPKKKSGRMWGHSRTLSRVEAIGLLSSSHLNSSSHLGTSVPSIPDYVYSQLNPPSVSSPEGIRLQQDICSVSQRVHSCLRSVHVTLGLERQRLQEAWSSRDPGQTASQKLLEPGSSCRSSSRPPSVAESAEYFDASDDILCGSSSEGSEEGSGVSDGTSNSEPEEGHETATRKYRASLSKAPEKRSASRKSSGHRTSLPAVCPDNSHVGLMTILYNNIGKDLSRVSMPAALNEPINLLQRLCEELEYSELLDAADNTADPYERMVGAGGRGAARPGGGWVWVLTGPSAFRCTSPPSPSPATPRPSTATATSPSIPSWGRRTSASAATAPSASSASRSATTPPYPPAMPSRTTSASGKTSDGRTSSGGSLWRSCPLEWSGDHYEWNKAVTCIHNVLSQQRYLEHYGEVAIHNLNSPVCSCKINFIKSRYWGSEANKNEVQGVVLDQSGHVVHRFGGFWHEGIFCDTLPNPQCVWKPNPQPKDSILYFGFSSFAIELNELTGDLQPLLPPTDTRLRPDQRMLEEGRIEETDRRKDEIEERQRERRKTQSKTGEEHVPRFFRKSVDAAGRDVWVTNGTYWKLRENPGFSKMKNPELW
ncbi:oxysterol-binding protein-related protein 7 isoform X2 [Denticeps clupeoides]|uniref:oxysterol-binding protein-related protein 7 isoform X2 n=1 Tax=Denticeps clupeoides TaxID=299321 RepID=UPI0010A466BD|nr:oxysterol-binding protein-related protein 7 isoform X2 [Denticeps clupeoides]